MEQNCSTFTVSAKALASLALLLGTAAAIISNTGAASAQATPVTNAPYRCWDANAEFTWDDLPRDVQVLITDEWGGTRHEPIQHYKCVEQYVPKSSCDVDEILRGEDPQYFFTINWKCTRQPNDSASFLPGVRK